MSDQIVNKVASSGLITIDIEDYIKDVKNEDFPSNKEQY